MVAAGNPAISMARLRNLRPEALRPRLTAGLPLKYARGIEYTPILQAVQLSPAKDSLRSVELFLTWSGGLRTVPPLSWGHSSAGRALAWHARGRRFDPAWLHQNLLEIESFLSPHRLEA